MAYSIETQDGIVVENIPDHIAPDSDVLKQRVAQARAQRADEERQQGYRDAAAGMSAFERGAANVGAGMSNLWAGVKQLTGNMTEDEIRDKRRMDDALAQSMTGGRVLQIAGEAAPMMALPVGTLARPAAAALRAGRVGPMTTFLASNAAAGAAGASLSPVLESEGENRRMNAAIGATLGVAVPAAGSAVAAGGRGAAKLLTEAGAQRRALEAIAEFVPDAERARLIQRLEAHQPPSIGGKAVDLPTSAAQATGDARLAQAEAMSRSRPTTGPGWQDFDAARNSAVFGAVQDLTPSALRVQRLERARDLATGPLRERAMAEAAGRADFTQPVLSAVDDLMKSAASANPAVASVARYVQRELGEEASGAVTPQRLYEVRKVLAGKLNGSVALGDELGAAAKGARRETMGIIDAIDNTLAGGMKEGSTWGQYLGEYGRRSAPVSSGRAVRAVGEEMAAKPLLGSAPQVTAAGLQNAVRKAGMSKYGSKYTPDDAQALGTLTDALKRSESASRSRKLAATMGGGSITNSDQLLSAFTDRVMAAIPGVGGYVGRLRNLNMEAVEAEMARLLQDPSALGQAMRSLPPSQRERMMRAAFDTAQTSAAQGAAAGATP